MSDISLTDLVIFCGSPGIFAMVCFGEKNLDFAEKDCEK